MIKFLLQRPIAVTVTLVALLVLSLVSAQLIPVSLMPAIDIPEIIVRVEVPETSASELESQYLNKIRRNLLQVGHLKDIESSANQEQGHIRLLFEYGTNINYAFIEVNEKIDAMMYAMPSDFKRPRVIKTSATDLPVFYLNVSLKEEKEQEQFMELSQFCDQVIKKRIEQLEEVAMADMSGTEFPEVVLQVNLEKLQRLGISKATFENALKANNYTVGNIKVRQGLYEFNVRYASLLKNRIDIENLTITVGERLFQIKELASISVRSSQDRGVCFANGSQAVVFAVIKKTNAKMEDLKEHTSALLDVLKTDYPRLEFTVDRNQTKLLDYAIGNLQTGLLLGAFLAFVILFLFLKDVRSPLLIGISVPLSLVISLLLFYLFDVSINIVSLSGLILGTGMMIDNAIIVIDNISQHRDYGLPVMEACYRGTAEVIRPLISSVLTTCAVFVPLVFIPGMAGALFYDQALAISIGLGVSLLVSFTVIPVYFLLFYRKSKTKTASSKNSIFSKLHIYAHLENGYETVYNVVFRNQLLFFIGTLLLLIGGIWGFIHIEKERFPSFEETEAVVTIDWNQNIHSSENSQRIATFLETTDSLLLQHASFVGTQSFVLDKTCQQTAAEATLYWKAESKEKLMDCIRKFDAYLEVHYPHTRVHYKAPETVFEKVFGQQKSPLEVRLTNKQGGVPSPELVRMLREQVGKEAKHTPTDRLRLQQFYELKPNYERMLLYQVEVGTLISSLKQVFNRYKIFTLKQGQYQVPVFLSGKKLSLHRILASTTVRSKTKRNIAISSLVDVNLRSDYKEYRGDKNAAFVCLPYQVNEAEADVVVAAYKKAVTEHPEIQLNTAGALQDDKALFQQLLIILCVSLLLLYFILAAQFESLLQPLIVFVEIPIDIAGALLLLYVTGNSLNLMALIGIIVMTGIIINDSILKIDTINKLRLQGLSVTEAIHRGGNRRLKPIVMTSLTTILAMLPFLFGNDMGSKLQQPLAIAIIGGMTIGTFVSLYFIPLCYYYLNRTHITE